MHYAVTSKHHKGFLTQTLVVRATDPDDACVALEAAWDMDDRVITRLRRVDECEARDIQTDKSLLVWTLTMLAAAFTLFVAIWKRGV